MLVTPRYNRWGVLQLFAGLNMADGFKYGQTSELKRFVDFPAFLLQTILPKTFRRKVHSLYLILDNSRPCALKQLET